MSPLFLDLVIIKKNKIKKYIIPHDVYNSKKKFKEKINKILNNNKDVESGDTILTFHSIDSLMYKFNDRFFGYNLKGIEKFIIY